VTEPDYKAMYEAERDKFQGETRVSWFLAERLRGARGSANRCDQCRQARGEWVVRRGDEVLWLCHPCTAGIRADVPPFIGAAEAAGAAAAPVLLAEKDAEIKRLRETVSLALGLARIAETAPEEGS
jgi:hypothetical protein